MPAITTLVREAAAFGISLSGDACRRFQVYIETLLLWRTRLSLTAASTSEQIVQRHIADSLALVGFVKGGTSIADLGSGAGFPGIPLAITCPAARVVLIEARRKRANFLSEVVRQAKLTNVEVLNERAESLGLERWRSFDIVVARAVGSVSDFLALIAPFLKADGLAIAMKGSRGLAEAVATTSLFSGPEIHSYSLAGNIHRMLLVYHRRG